MKTDWAKEIEQLKEQINQLENSLENLNKEQNDTSELLNLLKKYDQIEKLDRQLVETFIDKIYVSKIDEKTQKRTIKIEWKF